MQHYIIRLLVLMTCLLPGFANSQVAISGAFNSTNGVPNVFTPAAGSNRLLVYIIGFEDDDNTNDVTSVTYGGQSMTLAVQMSTFTGGGSENRVEIWILRETGITAATHTTFMPVFSVSNPTTSHGYHTSAVTLSSVNQNTPVCGTGTGVRMASTTVSLTTAGIAVLPSELMLYATSGGDTRTHAPNSGFTENVDLNTAGGGQGFSVGHKLIAASATQNLTVTASGSHNRFVMAAVRFIPPLASCSSALPIELLSFSGELEKDRVKLNWQTASEINNDLFVIERSIDFINWEEIVSVKGAGNSKTLLKYSDYDHNPYHGLAYYRLKQLDFDKTESYSNSVIVDYFDTKLNITNIYPNPAKNELLIQGKNLRPSEINISNILGQKLNEVIPISFTEDNLLRCDLSHLQRGIYFIKTDSGSLKFIKD